MRRKVICFILSAMLVLTFIPQISFANEEDMDPAASEEITAEEPAEETAPEPAAVITGFVPLDTTEYYYEGNPEENDLTLYLPETLSVYLDGSDQPGDISVSWEAVEDFDDTDFYFYSLRPVWDSSYVLSGELSEVFDVPWITVYRQEPENNIIEPVVTEDEAEPIYTEEEGSIDVEADYSGDTAGFSLKTTAMNAASRLIGAVTDDVYAASSNTDEIYKYLKQTMGLNTAAACGVMININAESAMSPINLQNTYNARFGLSDTEYTKAVDKGKGSYKTSGGKKQNFKTDAGGYGLCQWTSAGRKTNLLRRAIDSGKSIGNLNMQLAHLNGELQSYQQVLTTLKKVPNNAAGAYIAAAEFCLSFEIPANTINTAASRGRNCLSNYWKTYSGTSASATGTSFVSLCGYSYPTAVREGKGMDVTGYAVSNYKITSITGTISNSKGKALYTKTLKPNTTACKLSGMDAAMKFARLSEGTYTYTIKATDSFGGTVKATHTFKVNSSGSSTKALGFATAGSGQEVTPPDDQDTGSGKAYTGKWPKLPKRGYFKKGDKGKQVKRVQKFLKWYGYKVKVNGKYNKKTVKAVKKFQKKMGLKADGEFGRDTLSKAKQVRK